MKKVILIGGCLATGKTTLAKNLSKELNIPYYYKDILKERLGDIFGFNSREENLKLSKGAFEILYHISEQMVENEKPFILESNFRQNELDKLEKLFKENGYEIVSLKLTGDEKVLYQRYLDRFENENRSVVHANLNSFDEFKEYQQMLSEVNYPGRVIKIDTTEFKKLEEILKLI